MLPGYHPKQGNWSTLASLPATDESAYIVAVLSAVCRASLPLVPGTLISAPAMSGAGTGKGLLIRALCSIAFGERPYPFTTGGEVAELEKRITAALLEARRDLFIDN